MSNSYLTKTLSKLSWTQADLARKLGVGRSAVSQWMNGTRRPSLNHQKQMARLFGTKLDTLTKHFE